MSTEKLPFLRQVALALLSGYGVDLRDVAVVLPSQRAGLYLRKWIAEEAGKPLWSPQVFTLSSFMEELSGLRPLATEELLLEGYEAYRKVAGGHPQALGDYLQWASTTLADISEADAHLVPLDSYYRDLRHWEELEWTFNTEPLSKGQQRMVRFWAMVGKLHLALNGRLAEMGAGTTGLIERTAVGRIAANATAWHKVWFAGLNALTPAQEAVLQHFHQEGMAQFAWDADHYYVDDPAQEAGHYLRKAMGRFGNGVVPLARRFREGGRQLDGLRAPNAVAQAWAAAQALQRMDAHERPHTAVVLADETLLQPLLEALPRDMGPLNITMGLPVAALAVGALVDALHRLHAGHKQGTGFLHADLERFLGHPLLRGPSTAAAVDTVLQTVRGTNRMWCGAEFLLKAAEASGLPPGAAAVFTAVTDVRAQMPAVTMAALAWARQAMAHDAFATEQLFQASLVLRRIHLLLERYQHELDIKAYAALFRRLLQAARVGFYGEPLAGVQVMGMLEARALDHRQVIVLGAEEGTLPSTAAGHTFIPFELRRAHGMPLREDGDAVQAYNFMRLVQRCDKALLVWPEGGEPTGPSRFILQLEHELKDTMPIQLKDLRLPMPRMATAGVVVHKDEAVLEALRKRLDKGLSPSAVGDWLRCPLDFYFKHVLGLHESGAVDGRIAPNVLGEALHNAVEAVYAPLVGKPLKPEELETGASAMEELVKGELAKQMDGGQLAQGQPLLQLHMAVRAAQRFLRGEAESLRDGAVITVEAQEESLVQGLPEAAARIGSPVNLKGRLDRVDRCNGTVRVLDLKSGKVKENGLKVGKLALEEFSADKRYADGLLMYAVLYLGAHPEVETIQAGLLPLQRAASSEPELLSVGGQDLITRTQLPTIEELFSQVVQRMMDPEEPFTHDPESKYCPFCLKL
ncbi:MAG TPA: PD-(D/E)XK nuclease family protein [Flavobacteriales bacterium]|nr:PD-(D/E)XK nuclease family protein [Flavobacteriales bacterium]